MDQHQTHNTIQKLKIWSVPINSLFSNTTAIGDKTKHNLHYPIDEQRNSTQQKQVQEKIKPLTTTINTRKNMIRKYENWILKKRSDM